MRLIARPYKFLRTKANRWSSKIVKRRISFVIAGTIKGGTTTLDWYLRNHPQIGMCRVKEAHFFNNDDFFQGSKPLYEKYHEQYTEVWLRKILGEATPNYMSSPRAARRLYEYNPEMKLIFSLRNPVSRAFSHWNMNRQKGTESLPFGEAIRREMSGNASRYVSVGLYAGQLECFWQFFPKEQTLIFQSEELRNNHHKVVNRVLRFIGLRERKSIPMIEFHKRSYEAPMEEEDRKMMRQIFRPEIEKLEKLLNWDCSNWLE
ncbi:MAG TPA: sulfotransferase domain-containing protein [Verrucomicrobiae bacterium]|nr:sulfotransferase domain-containing protein [Verrucomicrobiae bacterium]